MEKKKVGKRRYVYNAARQRMNCEDKNREKIASLSTTPSDACNNDPFVRFIHFDSMLPLRCYLANKITEITKAIRVPGSCIVHFFRLIVLLLLLFYWETQPSGPRAHGEEPSSHAKRLLSRSHRRKKFASASDWWLPTISRGAYPDKNGNVDNAVVGKTVNEEAASSSQIGKGQWARALD